MENLKILTFFTVSKKTRRSRFREEVKQLNFVMSIIWKVRENGWQILMDSKTQTFENSKKKCGWEKKLEWHAANRYRKKNLKISSKEYPDRREDEKN